MKCTLKSIVFLLSALLFGTHAQASKPVAIKVAHSGYWFNAERVGEGLALEMMPNNQAVLYWYTYDSKGNQRWLTALGKVLWESDTPPLRPRVVFDDLILTQGGKFGTDFDPGQITRKRVGSATLRFSNCSQATFEFSAFGKSRSLSMSRLSGVMGVPCETPHGMTGKTVAAYAGESGSWFDPTHNGEGLLLQWLTPNKAVVTWYTYDAQGNQAWMYGTGTRNAQGKLHVPQLHRTRGGVFGHPFKPEDIQTEVWGELTLDLTCHQGNAKYQAKKQAFGQGELNLQRLTRLDGMPCAWTQQKLTDLYDVIVAKTKLPLDGSDDVFTSHVANAYEVYLLAPKTNKVLIWLSAGNWYLDRLPSIPDAYKSIHSFIGGGTHMLAVNATDANGASHPLFLDMRSENKAWLKPQGTPNDLKKTRVSALSSNGQHAVGWTSISTIEKPGWHWQADKGYRLFSNSIETDIPKAIGMWIPNGISDDGQTIIGNGMMFHNLGFFGNAFPNALYFVYAKDGVNKVPRTPDGHTLGSAVSLSHDGQVVFGINQGYDYLSQKDAGHSWYWLADSDTYQTLPKPDIQINSNERILCSVWQTDRLASMAVGFCDVRDHTEVTTARWPFVWTQNTGTTLIRDLIDDKMEDAETLKSSLNVATISISPIGNNIVIAIPNDDKTDASHQFFAIGLYPKHSSFWPP